MGLGGVEPPTSRLSGEPLITPPRSSLWGSEREGVAETYQPDGLSTPNSARTTVATVANETHASVSRESTCRAAA